MTRLDAIVTDIRYLIPKVLSNLREPVPQHKRPQAHGRHIQPPGPVKRNDLPEAALWRLERLRDALSACLGDRLQEPVLPQKTSEQQELEILRASLAPGRPDPILNVSEGGEGSRV